ncbi:MAG: lytic transglycosylase domain-containing protein [Atopobiaceae bacterium]|nr:lytic transglycosylase domain-containing protein [Atopobiaceae bacterium]MCH4181494.1 lytic transglycosylase domain-containing protein [Atopobiaceae bacterium]MCH4214425.1 lytic transglycosylase domain-containing protein [Atopobiaceae bacterium]MCH4229355.1 lytic transglycosylase domain-containing protein [Atopobiaceae bacterium]MCH4276687.1 lytic transglycosylase domain-containing protein [Atopobiaceae bacterium]
MSRHSKPRFWRWFRTVPLVAMLVLAVVSVGLTYGPIGLTRQVLCPVSHADLVEESATRHGIDPLFACAIIKCESGWDDDASSAAGAVGLMQLMPETAQEVADMGLVDGNAYDPADLTDPATNIEYGCAYLGYLQDNLDTSDEVVAAYNAGLGNVSVWRSQGSDFAGSITYAETRAYLTRVNDAYASYRRCYPDGLLAA